MLTISKFISLQASRENKAGNYELALAASRNARSKNIWGLVLGICKLVILCVIVGVLAYFLRTNQ